MAHPHAINSSDLFARLFQPQPPVIIDIRVPDDIDADNGWFPAAHRISFRDTDAIATAIGDGQDAVIVCQGGLKLSQGVASRIAQNGGRASYLIGGLVAWRTAALPLWRSDIAPGVWVGSSERQPGAAAALWLANRLLPKPSELLVVAADQVELAADRFDAGTLPNPGALLAGLERPVPDLAAAIKAAESDVFAQLCQGHAARDPDGWYDAVSADLDALFFHAKGAQ